MTRPIITIGYRWYIHDNRDGSEWISATEPSTEHLAEMNAREGIPGNGLPRFVPVRKWTQIVPVRKWTQMKQLPLKDEEDPSGSS